MKKEKQARRQRGGGGVHSSCWIVLLWICLFFCDSLPRADGFANNLIVTSVGCMTELDTSEVIMNNMVKAVDESDFPKMHLVVVDSQDNHIESPYHYSQQEIVVAFENPYTKEEFDDDLQYVMEILGPENNDGDPPTNPDAEWIHGGTIGCDNNKRVAARIQDYDGRATIHIHNPTKRIEILAGWATGQNSVRLTPKLILEPSTPKEIKKDDQEHEQEKAEAQNVEAAVEGDAEILSKVRNAKNGKLLEVVEKVKSKIASKKKKEQEENINEIQIGEEDDEDNKKGRKAEGHWKERKHEKDEDEGENTIKVHNKEEFMEVAKKLKAKRESAAQQRSEELSHEVNSNENDDRQQSSSEDRPEMKPITHRNSIHKLQQQQQKQHETHSNQKRPSNPAAWNQKSEEIRRKQLEKQMNENFPDRHIRELQMRSYLFACSFYLICIGLILMMFSKKKEKGRRDL